MLDLLGIVTHVVLAASQPVPHVAASLPIAVLQTTGTAAALPANEVVDRVQKFYANITQVTADFRQAVTNDTFGSTKTSDGKVYISKPGKMRWDYHEKKKDQVKTKKSFISNGTNLYVVEHDNMQVVKKNLQQDLMPVAVSFLYGKGDLKNEFNAELDTSGKYGNKGDYVLRLTPKQPSAQYKNLFLVVDPSNFRVTQSIIIDSSNNVNHFRFFAPDFAKPHKPTWFEFDERSVKNYRIIDADQQGAAGGARPTPPPASPAPAPAKKP